MNQPIRSDIETKTELLTAAWELFAQNGYENTPINDILARVGVSKGAFYHYFDSKEDLLKTIVDRFIERIRVELMALLEPRDLPASERLNRLLGATSDWRTAQTDAVNQLTNVLYMRGNLQLRDRLFSRMEALLVPVLTEIIVAGVKEESFKTAEPVETARFIYHLTIDLLDMQVQSVLEMNHRHINPILLERRANLYLDFLERLLGASEGIFHRSLKETPVETSWPYESKNELNQEAIPWELKNLLRRLSIGGD